MNKFAQTAVLVAGLIGLSACASDGVSTYGDRTAGSKFEAGQYGSAADALAACNERVARLEEMNKGCYRK